MFAFSAVARARCACTASRERVLAYSACLRNTHYSSPESHSIHTRLKMVPTDGPDDLSKREALLLQLEARRQAINGQEQADTVQRQRARTSWADSQRPGGANPTWDGLISGCRAGSIYTLVGLAVVASATHISPLFRSGSSPGGRAWLVCTAGMAGFFFNAEMAVVGSEAREKALQRSDFK